MSTWSAVGLPTAQRWDDAEGAGVVAADADGDPRRVRRIPTGRQIGWEGLQSFLDLDLRLLLDPGTFQQHRQRTDVVSAEHNIDPGRAGEDRVLVLLRQAATHGDLHARAGLLRRQQIAEASIEPVVGVLTHRAGVEDHDVRLRVAGQICGSPPPRANQRAARNRARSSGTRRCGSGRCAGRWLLTLRARST